MSKNKASENKLPPEENGEFTRCCICFGWTRNIHWHHTVPQALGGKESLQIPIDGNCHTTLHAKSEAVVSYLKGNRTEPPGRFWDKWESEQRAEPYLQILVQAMLDPPVEDGDKKIKLGQLEVDLVTRELLTRLKLDLPGVTNITQTLHYCIQYTLQNQGYKHETDHNKSTGKRDSNRSPNLRWVRGTKRRKSSRR